VTPWPTYKVRLGLSPGQRSSPGHPAFHIWELPSPSVYEHLTFIKTATANTRILQRSPLAVQALPIASASHIRRRNLTKTPRQILLLETAFEASVSLSSGLRSALATATGLTEEQVTGWFHNRFVLYLRDASLRPQTEFPRRTKQRGAKRARQRSRQRHKFTSDEVALLQQHFEVNRSTGAANVARVVRETGISAQVVRNRFSNLQARQLVIERASATYSHDNFTSSLPKLSTEDHQDIHSPSILSLRLVERPPPVSKSVQDQPALPPSIVANTGAVCVQHLKSSQIISENREKLSSINDGWRTVCSWVDGVRVAHGEDSRISEIGHSESSEYHAAHNTYSITAWPDSSLIGTSGLFEYEHGFWWG